MISIYQLLALISFVAIFVLPYTFQTPLAALFVGLMIAARIRQAEEQHAQVLEALKDEAKK